MLFLSFLPKKNCHEGKEKKDNNRDDDDNIRERFVRTHDHTYTNTPFCQKKKCYTKKTNSKTHNFFDLFLRNIPTANPCRCVSLKFSNPTKFSKTFRRRMTLFRSFQFKFNLEIKSPLEQDAKIKKTEDGYVQ